MTDRRLPSPRGRRGDRGIAVVFFAISVTALLAVGALVLGGSIGYTAVRSAQTAADSAALAGTTAIREHKQNWVATSAGAVRTAIETAAEDNGATLVECDVVNAAYAISQSDSDVIGDCDGLAGLEEAEFQAVAGVRVKVSETRSVPFAAFVDKDTITGSAVAAATAQAPTSGRSPFMVCTSPNAVGHPAQALIIDENDPTGYAVNDAAVGKDFVLHGNQVKYQGRDCGNPSSSWRGLVEFEASFAVPSADPDDDTDWWQTESGNKNGAMPQTLAGSSACSLDGQSVDQLEIGCRIAVPLCPKGNGSSSDFRLYCVKIGAFEISYKGGTTNLDEDAESDTPCDTVKNNIICGTFLGAATATGGQGRADTPDPNETAIIKLVQ